ncbi:DNA adenine methylase [Agrobacterium tumefaciens]|uniref:DNA adenine methylase n=2 Tax=Rhizobium/Agrobacterium group TaxID=227290 RepID=UPI001AEED15D|nr:DNA adenine methylase [Agrobacterium tumefaciens]
MTGIGVHRNDDYKMTRTASPLRYPGGKSILHNMVSDIIYANELEGGHYAEPFAGGGGLALSLLFEGVIREIYLNDIDPAIAAFWRSILESSEEFCELIEKTPVTIQEWHKQKSAYAELQNSGNDIALGFSTLFLNRTNRSGIIKGAGVIGGLQQTGNYLLDCRFNKADLIRRIKRIEKYKNRIHFTQLDALDFLPIMEKNLPKRSLICADPPYFGKGAHLYTSYYTPEDHSTLAKAMLDLNGSWITTYDNCAEISRIYQSRRQYEFSVQYSAQTKRLGSELLIISNDIHLPNNLRVTPQSELLQRA